MGVLAQHSDTDTAETKEHKKIMQTYANNVKEHKNMQQKRWRNKANTTHPNPYVVSTLIKPSE